MNVLDALLDPVAEDAGTRARWEAWEKLHGKPGPLEHVHGIVKGITGGPGSKPTEVAGHHVSRVGGTFAVKDPSGKITQHTGALAAASYVVDGGGRRKPSATKGEPWRGRPKPGSRSKVRPSSLGGALLRHDDGGPLDALLPLEEAADSMAKASTPEPFSSSRTSNWVARGGGLPAYIQHIAHDLKEKRGKSESNAIQMAIGIVKNWASGKGNVDANTRAAAAKAVAEWEKLKAGAHAKAAVQHSAHEEPSVADQIALAEAAAVRLAGFCEVLEADTVGAMIEAAGESGPTKVKCPKCDHVNAASASKCASCGHELSKARGAKFAKLNEAEDSSTRWAPELKRTASAPGESSRHEVHDGGQHVGTVAQRPSYGMNDTTKIRHAAYTISGREIRDMGLNSQQDAVDAVRRHLEEAPALVQAYRGGKYLVASPKSYGGTTTYTEYPNEAAARHAAGLPEKSTAPERASQVQAMAECVAADYGLVTAFGGALLPAPLGEAFNAALHPHGFHGHFRPTGRHTSTRAAVAATGRVNSSPRLPVRPDSRKADAGRFRGGALDEKGMIAQVHAHPSFSGWDRHTSDLQRGMAKDTESLHRASLPGGKLGPYSHERTTLHAQIIRAMLQGHKTQESPQAHFTAGGPASGKSAMIKSGDVKLPADHVVINPDVVKPMLPEYHALLKSGDPKAAALAHEESSHIAKLATNIALGQKMHVVVDSVGNSPSGKFAGKIRAAHSAGHEVHVHYATTSVEEALKREKVRAAKTGRKVSEGFLRSAHTAVSQRFHEDVQHLPVRVSVYDTTGKPKLVARKTSTGSLRVHDSRRYAAFLAKGGVSGA